MLILKILTKCLAVLATEKSDILKLNTQIGGLNDLIANAGNANIST